MFGWLYSPTPTDDIPVDPIPEGDEVTSTDDGPPMRYKDDETARRARDLLGFSREDVGL